MPDFTHEDWKTAAAKLSYEGHAYIGRRFVDAASGQRFEGINPETGEVVTEVVLCAAEDVDRAISNDRKAFQSGFWTHCDPRERKEVLRRLANLIRENLIEPAVLDCLEMGKLITDAAAINVPGSAHFFQWYAEAINMAAFGVLFNQGEMRSANSRVHADRTTKDRFVAKPSKRARTSQPVDPLDPGCKMGAIVDHAKTTRIMGFVKASKQTAHLVAGGERLTIGGKGCCLTPTIFDDVDHQDPLARDEVFRPFLSVITFESEDGALRLATDSIYGLAASVWTDNPSRADRLVDALQVGTVSVNKVDAPWAQTPFGGLKQSGLDRDLSLYGFDKSSAQKTTWIKYGT